jgi:hypothetical protein
MQDAHPPSRPDRDADPGQAEGFPADGRTEAKDSLVDDEIADRWADVVIDVAEVPNRRDSLRNLTVMQLFGALR